MPPGDLLADYPIKASQIAAGIWTWGSMVRECFEVQAIGLYSSRPSRGGGPYVEEHTYWLR